MRKKIVAGNWKCNTNLSEGIELAKQVNQMLTLAPAPGVTVILGTPFTHLAKVVETVNPAIIGVAAQNCAAEPKGAFTGEVSVEMIKSTGAACVIIGHSERREYYAETGNVLNKKIALAIAAGLTPIYCCGEPLAIREAGTQNTFVKNQLEETVFNLTEADFKKLIIAYEPIWAIGTGKTATSGQAQEIHAYIRSVISRKYGSETAQSTSILYGGSCNAQNAKELFANTDVDGGLIGGASLKAADFIQIVNSF